MIDSTVLFRIGEILEARKCAAAESSYASGLFQKGEDAILRKVGEEAIEVMLASKSGDKLHLVGEVADLWFHTLVLLSFQGLGPADVIHELRRREGISGIDEKAGRNAAQ
jgi:phosphoribosyl-ATP pyrophosphohydrolase